MKRAVRDNFDASPTAYDEYETRTGRFGALARRLAAEMAAAGGPFDRLLDAGAGTGASHDALAAHAGTVVALDISCEMLAAHPPTPRIVGDFDRLPFGDGTLDAVAFTASLFLVPDPATAVREARRVLRPAGVVGAVAPLGWRLDGEDALADLSRESRSPTPTGAVTEALAGPFRTETGTWSFASSGEDLRAFHRIPAMAARFYPKLPPDERVERVADLLVDVDADEQLWRWVVGVAEPA